MLRANIPVEVRRQIELLTSLAVQTLITSRVEVALFCALSPKAFHPDPMPWVGARSDEVVERQRQRFPKARETGSVPVDEFADVHAGRARRGDVLQCVVISTGKESHLLATLSAMPG
jgi:hypothetical protein